MWFHSLSILTRTPSAPCTWFVAIDLANALLFIHASMAHQKQFALSWKGLQYTFTVPPLRYISSPGLCHNVVCRDLDLLSFPQAITRIHYADGMMLSGLSEQEVATARDYNLCVCQSAGHKYDKNLVAFFLSEISSMLRYAS